MDRITEIVQKFPICCLKDTAGSPSLRHGKGARLAFGAASLRYFKRGVVNLLPIGPMTMETLILASLCGGAAAGMRLRVFVLFPMIILCLIVVTAWGLAQNQTVWSIIVMNFVGSACLQLGYLAGSVPSFMIAARQSRREHPQPVRPFAL
jgi:hypothetical protein